MGDPVSEIIAGVPNERERISDALRNLDFLYMRNKFYIPMHASEAQIDYEYRPKRIVTLVSRVIDVLTQHLYNPGPTRRLDNDEQLDSVLQAIFTNNHINDLMQSAEALSLLNSVSAFEIQATGDPADPIKIVPWGAEEFVAWVYPNDPTRVFSLATIERSNGKSRYKYWTPEAIQEFETEGYNLSVTSGARVAKPITKPYRNPYGILPFSFVHARPPVRDFWTPGIGDLITACNQWIDVELSNAANGARYYANPIPCAYNVDATWSPKYRAGAFMHIPAMAPSSVDGKPQAEPKLEYLSANLNFSGIWEDISNHINTVLDGLGIPQTSYRMVDVSAQSGIAIIAEQAPLLTWAKKRQPAFIRYEKNLVRTILQVMQASYDFPDGGKAVEDSLADLKYTVTWGEPEIPIPGPDRDQADEFELQNGLTSEVQIYMRRHGATREEALQAMARFAQDRAELLKIQRDHGLMPSVMSDDMGQVPQPPEPPLKGGTAPPNKEQAAASESLQGKG